MGMIVVCLGWGSGLMGVLACDVGGGKECRIED